MFNHDLIKWCKYLNIPINDVLSRNENVPYNHKQALFIYNLEPAYMSGSHWVGQKEKFNSIAPKQSDTKHTNNNLWVFLFILSK